MSFTMDIKSLTESKLYQDQIQSESAPYYYKITQSKEQIQRVINICAFCLKTISQDQSELLYLQYSLFVKKKYYVAHKICYNQNKGNMFVLNDMYTGDFYIEDKAKSFSKQKNALVQISIHHPISSKKINNVLMRTTFLQTQQSVQFLQQTSLICRLSLKPIMDMLPPPLLILFDQFLISVDVFFFQVPKKKLFEIFYVTGDAIRNKGQKLIVEGLSNYCSFGKYISQIVVLILKQKKDGFDSSTSKMSFSSSESGSKMNPLYFSQKNKEKLFEEIEYQLKIGNFYKYISKQLGSRYGQTYIQNCSAQQAIKLFESIKQNIKILITDIYGNHCIKSLINKNIGFINKEILEVISQNLQILAKNKLQNYIQRGSIIIQSIVDLGANQKYMVQLIEPYLFQLTMHQFSCHIIKKIIKQYQLNLVKRLSLRLLSKILQISLSQYGIIVVMAFDQFKYIVLRLKNDEQIRKNILIKFDQKLSEIALSRNGNLAVQSVLENFPIKECRDIIGTILARIIEYSKDKYSSNIVQKLLMLKEANIKKQILNVIGTREICLQLMKNHYGSFVLIQSLKESSGKDLQLIINSLHANLSKINKSEIRNKWLDILLQYQ